MRSPARVMISTRSRHGDGGPGGLRGTRRRDRVVHVGGRPAGERAEDDVAVDRRADLERAVAVAPGAGDVVPVVAAETGSHRRHARLELGVEAPRCRRPGSRR